MKAWVDMGRGRGAAVQRQRDTCPLPTLSKRKTTKGKSIERRGTKKGEEKSNDNITLPYPHSYSKKAGAPPPPIMPLPVYTAVVEGIT